MDWTERFNEVIDYIEEHITESIDYGALARIALCSTYHFQRMFAYIAGVPLSEYIRRRRMSLAAVDLQSGERVIDVGLKYGYSSPTAFNRAFQSVHGVAPSALRSEGAGVKSFPPLRFKLTVRGVEDGSLERIIALMDGEPRGVLGVSACGDGEEWRYYIAAASSAAVDEPLEEYTVPGCTWAIFPGAGTGKSIQELEQRIVTDWLPTSGYEFTEGPDVEVYFEPNPANTSYEVWIPVRKKSPDA